MLTSWADGSHPKHAIRLGAAWGMDNFAFKAGGFDAGKFLASLVKYTGLPGCLFVVAPDVWGDAAQTAVEFDKWREVIKQFGFPLAMAAQDGLEKTVIDWNSFDVLFVGGTNDFKFSAFMVELIHEARSRRKWTHMGRVNSPNRWRYCAQLRFDSCDGSGMVIERSRVLEALNVLNTPETPLWDWRPTMPQNE